MFFFTNLCILSYSKVFKEKDIHLYKDEKLYAKTIIKGLNKLAKEDPRCRKSIYWGGLSKSKTKSNGYPTFFATCDSTTVYFSEKDLGEKIDIVTWSEDKATYIVNSLAPAQISKVIFEEDTEKIKVIIPEDQLSLAIGRKGQNVRLASILTNCEIDIIDEKDEKNKRNEEIKNISGTFMKELITSSPAIAIRVKEAR